MEMTNIINSYLDIEYSNKTYYLSNNPDIKDENIAPEELFHMVHHDLDIIFRLIRLSPNKSGYIYWFDAVFLNVLSEKRHISICKDIYEVIALKYKTSAMSVERAMRLCFENTMYNLAKADENCVIKYMKNSLMHPHNGELLSKLTKLVISRDFQKQKYSF